MSKEFQKRPAISYLIRNYERFVLKPEVRNPVLEAGISKVLAKAHARYLDTLTTIDDRVQRFLSEHTRHLEVIDTLDKTELFVDWDAQKWKAPRYSADDAAFAAAFRDVAVSTMIATTIGPAIERTIAQVFLAAASRVIAGLQPEIYGFIAGSVAEPGVGSLAGWLAGAGAALIVDYVADRRRERLDRGEFERANSEALRITIEELSRALRRDLSQAVDVWFDDTRAIVAENELAMK
jgi:hypothetical protein